MTSTFEMSGPYRTGQEAFCDCQCYVRTPHGKWVVHGRPDSAILICQRRPAFICRNGMLMLSMPCSIRQASSRGVHHKPEAHTHSLGICPCPCPRPSTPISWTMPLSSTSPPAEARTQLREFAPFDSDKVLSVIAECPQAPARLTCVTITATSDPIVSCPW